MNTRNGLLTFIVAAALSACGGGDDASDSSAPGDGLTMASTMSVIAATDDGSSGAGVRSLHVRFGAAGRAFSDSGSDYSNDVARVYVYDESMEALSLVNEILCMLDQTEAEKMVNKGNYIALINPALCAQGQGSSSSTGQSSGGRTTQYEQWIVNSSRANNSSPQIVKIWIPEEDGDNGGGPATLFVEITVTEGVSTTNPFGKFVLDFEGRDDATGVVSMNGTLKTVDAINGKVAFTFYAGASAAMQAAGMNFQEATSVVMDPDGSAGVAQTFKLESFGGNTESEAYALAFDANNTLRQSASSTAGLQLGTNNGTCFSRTSFDSNVWRYGLYNAADGSRVELNSGFPFTYANKHGWIGYWGIWYEDQTASIANGETIHKMDFDSAATTPYQVVQAPGKLVKSTRATLALAALNGETFNYWGPRDPSNFSSPFGQWQVTYDSGFKITGEITGHDQNGPVVTVVNPPEDITPASGGFLNMWSEGLGGRVDFKAGNSYVTYYTEEFVQATDALFAGSDTAVTLKCFQRCTKAALSSSDVASFDGVYGADAADVNNAVLYTMSRSDMVLRKAGSPVALASGVTPAANSPHNWGIQSGNMVTTDVSLSSMGDIWDQAVSYRWETGANNWNKLVAVKNLSTGAFESFDKPIQFSYTHTTANDLNGSATYNNKTFRLNYGGFGDLWGIPSASNGSGRFEPLFGIEDGVLMGASNQYVVKAVEKEQRMQAAAGQCGALVVNAPAAPLPTAADGAPDIDSRPTVTGAPAVIAGEVQ